MSSAKLKMSAEPSSSSLYERAEKAARMIRARTNAEVSVAIVLGSGLGAFAEELMDSTSIPYHAIPGFARATVEGHDLEEVTFPIRVLKLLGVRTLVLTNAAGALNVEFAPGSLMVISDHLNLLGANPLTGPNDDRFGPRFPDLTSVYAPELQNIVIEEARAMGLEMRRGIYAALSGPSYETPAEIHMVRTLGADAVGMSTVPEAIVARHMEMQVIGISCITNLAAGVSSRPIDHGQVMAIGERVRAQFTELILRVVARLKTQN